MISDRKQITGRLSFNNNRLKSLLIQTGLIVLAAVLFAGSFPNPLFEKGFWFFAWFFLLPALIVIKNNNPLVCMGWGAVFGYLSYALFNYWLSTFHPMAGILVYCIYAFYGAVVFLLFKFADKLFPKYGYILQWALWISYEYIKTKGFLGYPYGIIGYSQWEVIPLIQIAGITGIWGISAIITFPSFYLAEMLSKGRGTRDEGQGIIVSNHNDKQQKKLSNIDSCSLFSNLRFDVPRPLLLLYKNKIPIIIWITVLITALIFGFTRNKDFSGYPQAQIALIQHNQDPWKTAAASTAWQSYDLYRNDLEKLIRLSNEALAANPIPQLVVWPETAFIPRIHWHSVYREDQNAWLIVKDLLDYLEGQPVPFLIGNDDARMDPAKNPDSNQKHRVDYNAAMLFKNGQNTGIYRKIHLVPFTEYFPYKKQLPFIYKALLNADTHFWEKGDEKTVFNIDDFTFSSPICFEDSFGYISRDFVKLGADILINITNDAWAKSLSAQNQHLSMAVFRAVENSRSMVRSAVSGQTCAIDPAGRIIAEAPPFIETFININVPIIKKITIYTLFGDFFGYCFLFISILLLIIKAIIYKIRQ